MNDDTLFLPGLSPVGRHDIHARFDGGALSSDGGVLLLREIERGMNFSGMLASCLHDAHDPGRTIHDHSTMIQERMFAIACGYEDCDDLDGHFDIWKQETGLFAEIPAFFRRNTVP